MDHDNRELIQRLNATNTRNTQRLEHILDNHTQRTRPFDGEGEWQLPVDNHAGEDLE